MKVKNILLIGIAILSFIASSQAQNVNIPNAIFKEVLLGDTSINTNGDAHIQVSEASVFNGAINVSGLGITNLTGIEAFLALTYLNCSGNQLTNLNVSACTALTYLDCSANLLMIAEVSQDCEYPLPYPDSMCYEYFYFFMDSLDVSANTALTYLICKYNHLTNLNVTANTSLTYLECQNNQLICLDVSQNTDLIVLWCQNNQLSCLDVSQNSALIVLFCPFNQLTSLNVKNGNNINMLYFFVGQNPPLSCINVDDATWSTANWTVANYLIDPQHYFSNNCSGAGISDINLYLSKISLSSKSFINYI